MKHIGVVVSALSSDSQDLGSNPRSPYYLFFPYYNSCPIDIQAKRAGWVEETLANDSQDLGSNPRSPISLLLFSFRNSSTNSSMWCTMVLKSQSARWPPGQIWWLRLNIHHRDESMDAHWIRKSTQACMFMGLEFAIQTSKNQAQPLTHSSFYFISLFCLIIFII